MTTISENNEYYYLKYTFDMFNNGFNFRGRTNRTCYWIQILEFLSVIAILIIFNGLLFLVTSFEVVWVFSLFICTILELAVLVPRWAMMVRRNHDFDISGWWLLFVFVPYAGFIVMIVFGCIEGTTLEDNRFGPKPGADNLSTKGIAPAALEVPALNNEYYYLKYTFDMFNNGFNFRGRTNRTCYWLQSLEFISVVAILAIFSGLLLLVGSGKVVWVFFLFIFVIIELAVLVPRWAMMVRRNHDFDISGWWLLFVFVPYAGFIVMIVFGCIEGTTLEDNRFGPKPGVDNLSTKGIEPAALEVPAPKNDIDT